MASNIALNESSILPTDELLTQKEFAEMLKVSLSTVSRGIRANLWPYNQCITIGRTVRYNKRLIVESIQKLFAAKQEAASRELGVKLSASISEPSPIEQDGREEGAAK
jgi:hypothetical protein